jgi:uncharacterized protein (DUF305 family)
MFKLRSLVLTVAVIGAATLLSACSSSPGMHMGDGSTMGSSASGSSSTHNATDIAFATDMIPHHKQAVQMADTILSKSGIDPRVTALATQIKAQQAPQITEMSGWLKNWGAPQPADMSGMSGMSGLMSPAQMSALDNATGLAASKLFLTEMTQHHDGAISMAATEMKSGKSPEAMALAKTISSAQSEQIKQMASLLAAL